jgi:hypothetical protein
VGSKVQWSLVRWSQAWWQSFRFWLGAGPGEHGRPRAEPMLSGCPSGRPVVGGQRTLYQVLQPSVLNAPSLRLIVTVLGPLLMSSAMIVPELPVVSVSRAQ